MLVALEEKVYLVDVLTLNTEMVFPTIKMNESERYNMISMSTSFTNFLLALPSYTKGYVTLVYPSREKQRRVKAHSSSNQVVTQASPTSCSVIAGRKWPLLHKRGSISACSVRTLGRCCRRSEEAMNMGLSTRWPSIEVAGGSLAPAILVTYTSSR